MIEFDFNCSSLRRRSNAGIAVNAIKQISLIFLSAQRRCEMRQTRTGQRRMDSRKVLFASSILPPDEDNIAGALNGSNRMSEIPYKFRNCAGSNDAEAFIHSPVRDRTPPQDASLLLRTDVICFWIEDLRAIPCKLRSTSISLDTIDGFTSCFLQIRSRIALSSSSKYWTVINNPVSVSASRSHGILPEPNRPNPVLPSSKVF